MREWIVEKMLEKPDGKEYVQFLKSPNTKLYRFDALIWELAEEDEKLYYPEGGFLTLQYQSGYYASLQEC